MPRHGPSTLRLIVATLGLLLLGSCATTGGTPGPPAPAPTYQVGDRWVYRVQDGFRVKITWEETHQVTVVSPQGITVRVTAKGPSIDDQRTETWSAPGVVLTGAVFDNETRRFEPPLVRYKFPLTGGERWSQRMRDLDHDSRPYGGIDRSVSVGGYEKITTPAGTFDAIRLQVFMRSTTRRSGGTRPSAPTSSGTRPRIGDDGARGEARVLQRERRTQRRWPARVAERDRRARVDHARSLTGR